MLRLLVCIMVPLFIISCEGHKTWNSYEDGYMGVTANDFDKWYMDLDPIAMDGDVKCMVSGFFRHHYMGFFV